MPQPQQAPAERIVALKRLLGAVRSQMDDLLKEAEELEAQIEALEEMLPKPGEQT